MSSILKSHAVSLLRKRPWSIAYVAVCIYFLFTIAAHWTPKEGFTSMLIVGDSFYQRATSDFKGTTPRVFENSSGYDGQFYVQIALDPSLEDPELPRAIDNLPYRGRRILMPATAWILGLGQPKWIVHLYPLINPMCWIISALLLTRWLPPDGFQNFIRWAGILLGWGWTTSIQHSLTDGPAASITLLAIYFIGRQKKVAASWSIAASVLTKDTSILAGLAMFPSGKPNFRNLSISVGLGILTLLPFALWYLYMSQLGLSASSLGSRNFSLPFVALTEKLSVTFQTLAAQPHWPNIIFALGTIGLCLQIVFVLIYPKWKNTWWRCGIGFAALGAMLGPAVWEGLPGAAPRILLVLHIVFNILIPRTKAWIPLLLLGNVSLLDFHDRLRPAFPSENAQKFLSTAQFLSVEGDLSLNRFNLEFLEGWEPLEQYRKLRWRWTNGAATINLKNEYDKPIETRIKLRVSTHYHRTGELLLNGESIFTFEQSPTLEEFVSPVVVLQAGDNILSLRGDPIGQAPSPHDDRPLGLSLFKISLMSP